MSIDRSAEREYVKTLKGEQLSQWMAFKLLDMDERLEDHIADPQCGIKDVKTRVGVVEDNIKYAKGAGYVGSILATLAAVRSFFGH